MPHGLEKDATAVRRVVVLGATGSIGRSALDVIAHDAGRRLRLHGIAARSSDGLLLEQARRFRPRVVALADIEAAARLERPLAELDTRLIAGPEAVERLAADPEADVVVSAIVGAAGLRGTWAALEAGKTVALANKETLVLAGPLVVELAGRTGARLLPVDSEHSAIFQAMQSGAPSSVRRVVLTSSGGPFRGRRRAELADVTPEQALKHPTWSMGPKITIDSATLMNKALEVIEARWLFDLRPEQIDVVIHPESIIHSLVEFVDGSVIAQLSPPDMRLPIQYALHYPERVDGPAPRLDLGRALALHFEPPDPEAFPALGLAAEVLRAGGTAGAALNAANEAAVARFLDGSLRFPDIARACRAALQGHPYDPRPTLDDLWRVDAWARREVARWRC
jgi:1-deoxy-D-xylulose-5-phosphate reductoisomerase